MIWWFIEIPIIAVVLVAMLVGSIQPGPVLCVLAIAAMIAGVIICAVAELRAGQKNAYRNGVAGVFCFVQGLLILIWALQIGSHNLFEILF